MPMQTRRLRAFAFAAGLACLFVSAWASADPPSRVARLGYTSGAVSFSPAGENDWVEATINRPLTTGDRLWADAGARAELQVGGAMLRMSAGTSVAVLESRRQHRPAAVDAGHVEPARAPARARPDHRDRHAQSRLHRAPTRRVPDRRGCRRQCYGHLRAQGPGRRLWRRALRTSSTRASRIASRAPACATTSCSPSPDTTSSIAGRWIATAATTHRSPRAMFRRT